MRYKVYSIVWSNLIYERHSIYFYGASDEGEACGFHSDQLGLSYAQENNIEAELMDNVFSEKEGFLYKIDI